MTAFEKTIQVLKNPWLIISYAILAILVYHFLDRNLALYLHQLEIDTYLRPLKIFTSLGLWFVYVGLFIATGIYFRFIRKHALNEANSWFLLGCVLIPNMINFVLKISLSRARPELLFSENLFGFYWFQFKDSFWSFPSGHAVTIAAVVSGLGVLIPKYFYYLLAIALLVAASRVMLCRHYLSDVMIGFYYSMLVVSVFAQYFRKNK